MQGKNIVILLLSIVLVGVVIVGVVLISNANTEIDDLEKQLLRTEFDYNETLDELTKIHQLYPLNYFTSERTLQEWIDYNLQPMTYDEDAQFKAACKMVNLAMDEGYWIGIDLHYNEDSGSYWVFCSTFVGGQLYYFLPDMEMEIIETGFYR